MERAAEVGACKRYGERKTEACAIQLVDRNYGERAWLRLLGSAGGIGIGPVNLALLWASHYHSGVGASNVASIALLSAR